jgi:hypothetical protein
MLFRIPSKLKVYKTKYLSCERYSIFCFQTVVNFYIKDAEKKESRIAQVRLITTYTILFKT